MKTMSLRIVLLSHKHLANCWSYDTFPLDKVNNLEPAQAVL